MEGKNELFQRLKLPCVSLGQAALSLNGPRGNIKAAIDQLEALKRVLPSAASTEANALDAKLAEYTFFPIAQLLKVSQKLPLLCLELSLQCIAILIAQGWRQDVPAKLAAQIVILCSLLAEKKPKGLSFSETTEELQASSFWCLHHLFSVVGGNLETKRLLTGESNFPQLGQTISVILDGIHDGSSVEVQISATSALDSLVLHVADRETQAGFLPGIVSKLTKVLMPQTKQRRSHRVLRGCLKTLKMLLQNTLDDGKRSPSQDAVNNHSPSPNHDPENSIIDAHWQESAATQLKPALTNILRLKSHSRDDVKDAVGSICLTLLQRCRVTLANCSRMSLEVLVAITAGRNDSAISSELAMLLNTDFSTSRLLQDLLYDWLQSLTTIMQGSDEQAKGLKVQQIRMSYELLAASGADMNTIDRALATTLRDSVVVTLAAPMMSHLPDSHALRIESMDVAVLNRANSSTEFASPLVRHRGQEESLASIESLVKLIGLSTASVSFTTDLARQLRHSHGETRVANFWLLLTAVKTTLEQTSSLNEFLDLEDGSCSMSKQYLEEIYAISLSTLLDPKDEATDPRMKALALRGLAFRAQTAAQEFRYELVDALYPVLHTLATPNDDLQRDSITTLNIFTSACGYTSVEELIVENVDYLTNAVALKLNAFDISPQAPQVLLMMVRLAGPSLLPYLEDTVESIFAALEDYHGYPILVELLFKVLSVMAEEGVKAPQLAITNTAADGNSVIGIEKWHPIEVDSLSILLHQRAEEEGEKSNADQKAHRSHPQRPWNTVEESPGRNEAEDLLSNDQQDEQMDEADPPRPAPKTYNLLFKITELTQHFLPSASGSLRTSLLGLIRTTVPAIARHENSFLPLINTLWPEIASRLDDDEPHIIATALEIVKVLCEYAGDFMRSRILQLWPRLLEISQSNVRSFARSSSKHGIKPPEAHIENAPIVTRVHHEQAVSRTQAAPTGYGDTSARILWSSLAGTIIAIVKYIQLPPEIFDEALEMVEPTLMEDGVRSVFETENADAVWLSRARSAEIPLREVPRILDSMGWQFARAPE